MIVGLFRATTFAVKNIRRNVWLAIATEFLLILTTFSITLVLALGIVGNALLDSVESKVDIDFYFYTSVNEDTIFAAREALESRDDVQDVLYFSQEDALRQFRETHQDEPDLLNSLDELETNILPARLVVRAEDIDAYPDIRSAFLASEFSQFILESDDVDNDQIIDRMGQIISRASQIGIAVSLIFIVISVIVIFNTFRMTIYSHREEVAIMKLVGATNGFIRAPFIIEAIVLGVVASIISIGILFLVLFLSDNAVTEFFSGYDFTLLGYFVDHWPQLVFGEILGAVAFSVGSSMIAITRHLRV
jgi:cell division transport system permease protein